MLIKEQVIQELNDLNELEISQVAEYVSFLKFRTRFKPIQVFNEKQLTALYSEFADEDSELAEDGMLDYKEGLMKEDSQ
jgi:hypothetical protein